MDIRPVISDYEIAETAALAEEIWSEYWPAIIGEAQTRYMINEFQSTAAISRHVKDGYLYFLAGEKDSWDGYCAVIPENGRMMISKLYVKEAARGRGIGKAMMATIKTAALEQNCTVLWLVVNRNNELAIAVYEAMGFVCSGTRVKDIGNGFVMDDYIYELSL